MAKNPSQYGLSDIPVDPPLRSDTVTTDSSINLSLVADLVGTTTDEIQQLNPSLLQMSTPSDFAFDLHLPTGTRPLFQQRLALETEEHQNAWRFHIATQDDTLASIAQTFHVTTKELAAANRLREDDSIHKDETLLIPVPPPAVLSAHMRYRVRRGDTMVTLADRFGTYRPTAPLEWNSWQSSSTGRLLYVPDPVKRTTDGADMGMPLAGRTHILVLSGIPIRIRRPEAAQDHRATRRHLRIHHKKKIR